MPEDIFANLSDLLRSRAALAESIETVNDDDTATRNGIVSALRQCCDHLDAGTQDPAALLLRQALSIVTGARRAAYGTPEDNFSCIADLWNAYLNRRRSVSESGPYQLTAADIAAMMVLMKVARLAETPGHADSWRDTAGYAACGARASQADLS